MDCNLESAFDPVEIEARQDAVLRDLTELEQRIEAVLAEYLGTPAKTCSPSPAEQPPIPVASTGRRRAA
jgi:hypothetical protein